MSIACEPDVCGRLLCGGYTLNKPFEWTGLHKLSAPPPQVPCLPLTGSVRWDRRHPCEALSIKNTTHAAMRSDAILMISLQMSITGHETMTKPKRLMTKTKRFEAINISGTLWQTRILNNLNVTLPSCFLSPCFSIGD